MAVVPLVLLYVFMLVTDYLPTKKELAVKERIIYLLLFSVGFCALVLYLLDIPIPSPTKPIKSAVEKILFIADSIF